MTKTIDINCREWFDKLAGNSYFAGSVTVNYGMADEKSFLLPLQYGYDRSYEATALNKLKDLKLIESTYTADLRQAGIILRSHLQTGCKKRELL